MSARIFVPGRIEVLGKHTDYAGGSSLLIAVERGFTFEAAPLDSDRIVVTRAESGEQATYTIVRRDGVVTAVPEDAAEAEGTAGPEGTARPGAARSDVTADRSQDSLDRSRGTADRSRGTADRSQGTADRSRGTADRSQGTPGRSRGTAERPQGAPDPSQGAEARPAGASRPSWARYVDGVVQRAFVDFGEAARGATIRFRSDLPIAAGLSSSSALVCGLFLALDGVCRFSGLRAFRRALPDRAALAGWLSAAEMGGPVGTRGGSEDHVAILCAEPGRIVRYRLAPIRARGSVPVPDGWTFVVGSSGVVADKGGAVQAHYNRLSDLAARAARAAALEAGGEKGVDPPSPPAEAPAVAAHRVRADDPDGAGDEVGRAANLGDALDRARDAVAVLARVRAGAAALGADVEALVRRARHFLEECALVDAAFAALERGAVEAFAAAANRSADLGADLLGNQVPETLRLVLLARECGAAAASPFGGGFGGSVWALVRDDAADRFVVEWSDRYTDAFPNRRDATFFITRAGGPATTLVDAAGG